MSLSSSIIVLLALAGIASHIKSMPSSEMELTVHKSVCKTIKFPAVEINLPHCAKSFISMKQCAGVCHSVDAKPTDSGKGKSHCKRCQPVRFMPKRVELMCLDADGSPKATWSGPWTGS